MVSPDVTTHGPETDDPAEIAVVGGVHGDEPSGVEAVKTLREAARDGDLGLQERVKFVVANPPAVEADERGLDTDMNRSFPGDRGADAREKRLAAKLVEATSDCHTLSVHATHAQPDPIAFVNRDHRKTVDAAAALPVEQVVDESATADGAFTDCPGVVTVEAGCQHTESAADTAERIARSFLAATDSLPQSPPPSDPEFYELRESVAKPPAETYQLDVENFERVEPGETWARVVDDGNAATFEAEEPFTPILMSETGYDDVFGYRGAFIASTLPAAQRQFSRTDPGPIEVE